MKIWGCRFLFFAILLYGAALRFDRLLSEPDFVHPDALKHSLAAEELSIREPSSWLSVYRGYAPFAWTTRLMFGLVGHDPMVQRLQTVLFSVVLIALVGGVARYRWGMAWGLFAALLAASSPALVETSDSGIREDFYACLWAGLYFVLAEWVVSEKWEKWRWAVGAAMAWLVFLVRVDSAIAVAGAAGVVWVVRRGWRDVGGTVAGLALFGFLIGLVLVANEARRDDPFYFVDREKSILRYWTNLEFAGQPGFPSVEEVEADSRAGGPLSAVEYFGGVLGWKETAARFVYGYRDLFLKNILTGVYSFDAFPRQVGWFGLLTLLGVGVAIGRREFVLPLLIPLLVVGAIWTYNIRGGRDMRLFTIVVPFAILLATQAMAFLFDRMHSIRSVRVGRAMAWGFLVVVLANPWNSDLKVSYPWRIGPALAPPASAAVDPPLVADGVELVGWEARRFGPLGITFPVLDTLAPGGRFVVRTWWRAVRDAPPETTYRVVLNQASLARFGTIKDRPVAEKVSPELWRAGEVVMDEIESVVYPRVPPGETRLSIEVETAGNPDPVTRELTVFTLD